MVTAEIFGFVDRRASDIPVGRDRRIRQAGGLDGSEMTRKVVDWLYRFRIIPWAAILVFLPIGLWPASWWLEVRDVNLSDAQQGGPVVMAVDRSVHRSFRGHWSVTVRQWDGAGWVTYCNAQGSSNYRADARFPVPLTLKWWTDGQCYDLSPGKYRITTRWQIDAPLPSKTVTAESNVFEVTQ
jgi:hypothetical protein